MEDKADSYRILRWMMREFNFLRAKDNLDISTKRPRMADEYLAAVYAMKLSRGIYRITDKGKNVTFKDVTRVIDIAPNYILKNIKWILSCKIQYYGVRGLFLFHMPMQTIKTWVSSFAWF